VRRRSTLFVFACLLLSCAREPRDSGEIVLSYEHQSPWCSNCPHYRVDISNRGTIRFHGFSGCAVPGEQVRRVSQETFDQLRRALAEANFFGVTRRDTSGVVTDGDVVTVAYRDDRRVHEVIETGGGTRLEPIRERFREAIRLVDTFINPSVDEYVRLLGAGWDVNTIGTDGENALTSVVARDAGAARLLLQNGATVSPAALRAVVDAGDLELLRSLIERRGLEATSAEAEELLARAAARNTAVMAFLLDFGADPNASPPGARTPIAAAVSSGSAERVRLLLARGADPRRTPNVMLAAVSQAEDSGIITLLARHGADVNQQGSTGRTALITASDLCRYWHIEALLAAGADPRIANGDGRTALQPQTALATPTESCKRSLAILEKAAK
jgi:ankyrin repeat protein